MYTIENRVGRFVELRVEAPVTEEELLQFHDTLAAAGKFNRTGKCRAVEQILRNLTQSRWQRISSVREVVTRTAR